MIKEKNPLVSVVVTNYNYKNFVSEAIESVLSQTYDNIEIIVIDDGSTDGSVAVIEGLVKKNKNIRFLKQSNQGVVLTRNLAIDESTGEYLLYLDSDDKIPSEYVESLLSEAEKNKLDVVYCNFRRFGDEHELRVFPEFNIELIKSENIVHISSLIKKSSLSKHRFDVNLNRRTHEDWDFFLGLALAGLRFGKAPDVELCYRSHGQSRSYDIKSSDELSVQGLGLFNTHVYIINKYKKRYPGEIDFTEKSEIVRWWRDANERLTIIKDYKKALSARDALIDEQRRKISERDKQLTNLLNSKRYKLGSVLTHPISELKSMLQERLRKK